MCMFLLSLAATALVFYFITQKSPLSWTTKQEAFHSALTEIVILCAALFASFRFVRNRGLRLIITAIILSVFAYIHSFLLPFFVAGLYFLMFYMTGHLLCRLIARDKADDLVACIVLGTAGMLLLIVTSSVVGVGTAESLKCVLPIVFLAEAILCARKVKRLISNCCSETISTKTNATWQTDLFLAILIASYMIQVGRANISQDYDFLWYGARADDVLAPYTGIYDKVISTAFVYYYPKGYEALTLPFYSDYTYSFVYSVNLMFTAAVLIVVYKCVCLFTQKTTAVFCCMCCAVTAGIMNMAVTAKQDSATLLLQLSMIYFSLKVVKEKKGSDLMLAISAGLLSLTFKTTSMVFSSAFLCLIVIVAIVSRVKLRARDLWIPVVPLLAVIAIFARSYLLTGMPFPLFAQKLLNLIGFSSKYPYNSKNVLNNSSILDVLRAPLFQERFSRLLHFFFWPNTKSTDHVIIAWGGLLFSLTWFGHVFNVLFHPVQTWKRVKENGVYAFSLFALILMSFLSGGSAMVIKQMDGNYFMLWYSVTFLHTGAELMYLPETLRKRCTSTVVPLALCGIFICTASNWAWSLGFTPIDITNAGYYNHYANRVEYFERIGIDEICEELQSRENKARVMIFASDFPRIQDIPAVSDCWSEMMIWGNSSLGSSPEALFEYFVEAEIEYLLIEAEFINATPLAQDNLVSLAKNGYLSLYMKQDGFYLVQFHRDPILPDERLVGVLEGKLLVTVDGREVILALVAPLREYTFNVTPDVPAQTPSGAGAFVSDKDGFTVLSGYTAVISDVGFAENAMIYMEYSMPFEQSDGACATVYVVTENGREELASFDAFPNEEQTNGILLYLDNAETFTGDVCITVSSPTGDASADWVVFSKAGIYTD